MEAMDSLLMACHAQTLNLFVESFLKMVQKLLEDSNPQLQIMATNSFVKFANIEEDTPSYHRRYDFFIHKFSSMCHGSYDNLELQNNIRLAGIKGLQGVIRKTVSDELVENIWEKQHMEKIIPSLLFNMQVSQPFKALGESYLWKCSFFWNIYESVHLVCRLKSSELKKLIVHTGTMTTPRLG